MPSPLAAHARPRPRSRRVLFWLAALVCLPVWGAAWAGPPPGYTNGLGMDFVLIPAGTFVMGSPLQEDMRQSHEGPQHQVEISRPFYLQATLVTQGQWQALMGENPSHFRGDDLPVENVILGEVAEFIRRLNAREGGQPHALPSEAQWEYACRAGSLTPFNTGETVTRDQANYNSLQVYLNQPRQSPRRRTTPVKALPPNAWGLFDMHGNLWQWCADWYGADYYARSPRQDPPGPPDGERRVLRGGSWASNPWHLRSAFRRWFVLNERSSTVGFRLMRPAAGSETP